MFNPFKAHIIEVEGGKYAVRRLNPIVGWTYYDNEKLGKDNHWWFGKEYSRWFLLNTLDEAKVILHSLKKAPALKAIKVFK